MSESTQTAQTRVQIGAALRPSDPTSLGPYEVLRRLGQGGMGTVYLARNAHDPFVAIKVVKPEFAEDAQFTARFRHEAEAASMVPAFCTARVLGVDADADPPYLVTEFISGPTLDETIRTNGPLGRSDLEGLAVGMAAALSAIHAADVIHRDLKPSNVLLSPVGPRVIDFGIARALEFTTARSSQVVGTPAFMAPEQVKATGISPATDIFAWGGMLAFASSGEPAFGSGNVAALMYRIVHDEPDLRALDGSLRDLVQAAMSKNAADRPTSRELFDALVGQSAHVGAPSAATHVLGQADKTAPLTQAPSRNTQVDARNQPTTPLKPPEERRRRSVPWLTILLAVIAVVAVGLLVRQWLMSNQTGTADGTDQTVDTAGQGDDTDNSGDGNTGGDANGGGGERPNAIAVGGDPVTVDLPNGENARLTFTGEKGQHLSLGAANSTLNPASVEILDPNGESIESVSIYETTDNAIEDLDLEQPLPKTGEYTIVVDPDDPGSVDLTLSQVQAHDIAVNGEPVALEFTRPGQDAHLTFSGEAGAHLSLIASRSSLSTAAMRVIDRKGDELGSATIYETTSNDFYDLDLGEPLSKSGEYTIVVDPDVAEGDVTLTLTASQGRRSDRGW